ncbi:unnamed protein product [Penicillium pancosmium]
MSRTITIFNLPNEILRMIADNLDVFIRIWLQQAEITPFANRNDLYACQDCIKLRPRAKFADNMVKKKKSKWGPKATERWCVDCGLNPRPGTNRYAPNNIIVILGKPFVICLQCRKFGAGVSENGRLLTVCQGCRRFTRAIEERVEAERARRERARLRAEQAERRARRREVWGSASDSDEMFPPSPTSSEEYMDMIQAEADTYMNSPGAGSD